MLRGAALLGVFVENAQHFFAPTYRALVARAGAGFADHAGALADPDRAREQDLRALRAALRLWHRAADGAHGPGLRRAARLAHGHPVPDRHVPPGAALVGRHPRRPTRCSVCCCCPFRARSLRTLARAAALALAAPTLALAAIRRRPASAGEAASARVAADVVAFGYPLRQALFAFAMFLLGLAAARARGQADDPLPALLRGLPWLLGARSSRQPRARRAGRSLRRVDRLVDGGVGRGAGRARRAGARARLRRRCCARSSARAGSARSRRSQPPVASRSRTTCCSR